MWRSTRAFFWVNRHRVGDSHRDYPILPIVDPRRDILPKRFPIPEKVGKHLRR
jgi:hypothetical protein